MQHLTEYHSQEIVEKINEGLSQSISEAAAKGQIIVIQELNINIGFASGGGAIGIDFGNE